MKKSLSFKFYRRVCILALLFGSVALSSSVFSQGDTLSPSSRQKLSGLLNNFEIIVYMDAYCNVLLNRPSGDTSNIVEFASNSPFIKEFRLNVASLWLYYNAKNFRGRLELQFGDAPNLLADPSVQFIKNMKLATFGFRAFKTLWVDLGYQYNPIGYESSFPIRNQLSGVTVGGYYETGNYLGVKVSATLSPSVYLGAYIGNPYTLAYGRNTRLYAGLFFQYSFKDLLTVNYNNMMGDANLSDVIPHNFYLYNNLYVTITPVEKLLLAGQVDFAWITNASKPPDTTKAASFVSGFLQASYTFTRWFTATVRGEYLSDADGAMTTLYAYDGKLRGLLTYGGTVGVEFRPVKYSYIRAEYSYLSADKGNMIFSSDLADNRNLITFTAGLKFGLIK